MSYIGYLVRVMDSGGDAQALLDWGRSCFRDLSSGVYTPSRLVNIQLVNGSGIEGTFVRGVSTGDMFRVGLYVADSDVLVRLFIGEELAGMVRGSVSNLWGSGSGVLSRDFPALLSAVVSASTLRDVCLVFSGFASGFSRLGAYVWVHALAPVGSVGDVHPGDLYYLDGRVESQVIVTAVEGDMCEIGDASAGLESSGDWVPVYRLWSGI